MIKNGEIMKNKEKPILLIVILVVLIAIISILYIVISNDVDVPSDYLILDTEIIIDDSLLNIFFFDVGQGDSTLIMKNGQTMLIDGGNRWDGERLARYLTYLNVERIDYLIATHIHADHIGGLGAIIENFEIGVLYMPRTTIGIRHVMEFLALIEDNELNRQLIDIGYTFYLGYARNEIMFVDNYEPNNLNLTSIVIQMTHGDQVFLFMADSVRQIEDLIEWNEVNVLRVGHHGSNTSSTERFLNQTNPEVAIISVGRNNTYGHPHELVLYRLSNIGAVVYRTDERGTIWLTSDGMYNTIKTER